MVRQVVVIIDDVGREQDCEKVPGTFLLGRWSKSAPCIMMCDDRGLDCSKMCFSLEQRRTVVQY